MLRLGMVILQLEKARRELMAVDPSDKEKLMGASQKVDKLMWSIIGRNCTGTKE